MFKALKAAGFVALLALVTAVAVYVNAASAALNPTVTVLASQNFGSPGSPIARFTSGLITLGASDTYVVGGFTLTAQQLGFTNSIAYLNVTSSSGAFQPVVTIASTGASATVKLNAPITQLNNIPATTTSTTVPAPSGVTLNVNTPINCTLNDAAGGGATGTWGATASVSKVVPTTSPMSYVVTSSTAGPTSGGNFECTLPGAYAESTTAASVASITFTYSAGGN